MTESVTLIQTKLTWKWDLFGSGQMVVEFADNVPEPSWRQRLMTSLLFGSKWTRL